MIPLTTLLIYAIPFVVLWLYFCPLDGGSDEPEWEPLEDPADWGWDLTGDADA